MHHAEETLRRWREMERLESMYQHWTSLFCQLTGDPDMAHHLCELGMRLVRGEVSPGLELRRQVEGILQRHNDMAA